MLKAIVCVSKNFGIGKKNGLLFNLPADLRFFKEKTLNNTVVFGYNTLLSLPGGKPLKDRANIVICPDGIEPAGCTVFHDFKDLLSYIVRLSKEQDVFICGGQMLYTSLIQYCDELLITKVDAIDDETTAFFPNVDNMTMFNCIEESEPHFENGLVFKFCKYIKVKDIINE